MDEQVAQYFFSGFLAVLDHSALLKDLNLFAPVSLKQVPRGYIRCDKRTDRSIRPLIEMRSRILKHAMSDPSPICVRQCLNLPDKQSFF